MHGGLGINKDNILIGQIKAGDKNPMEVTSIQVWIDKVNKFKNDQLIEFKDDKNIITKNQECNDPKIRKANDLVALGNAPPPQTVI